MLCRIPAPVSGAIVASWLLVAVAARPAAGEDWAQFRGPNASGVSTESTDLPVEFSHENKVLWSTELGEGIACPVIANGRAYATAMTAPQTFTVFCFDAATGEEHWRTPMETGELPAIIPPNVPASSTPAADDERVYVHVDTIGLMALDAQDGRVVWKQPLQTPFFLMGWGAAWSPIVYEDMVIFCQEDDLAPFLVAFDKKTGDQRWRTERPEMLAGYSVPVLCTADGRTDLVIAGTGKLKGYDPRTGEELWSCNSLLRTIMSSPVVVDDIIYITSQSYGDTNRVLKYALLEWKDTNQDAKLGKDELPEAFHEKFEKGDADQDGFLVDDEIDRAFQAPTNMVGGGNILQAIRGGGSGDVTATHMIWNLDNPAPSNIVSPLVSDGRLFVVKKGGISASFDAETGETVWEKKRIRNFGNYYASPVAGDGKIYVVGENGIVVVIKDAPELEVLAKNDLGEPCIATPAIANNRLYFRTMNKLYCFSNEAPK